MQYFCDSRNLIFFEFLRLISRECNVFEFPWAAWIVLMINSSAQRAKWTDQTAPSSEQTANGSIEEASSKVKTALSSCRSAWSTHMKCLDLLQTSWSLMESFEKLLGNTQHWSHRATWNVLGTTILHLSALPVPLLRQVHWDPPGEWKTIVFIRFFEDGAEN